MGTRLYNTSLLTFLTLFAFAGRLTAQSAVDIGIDSLQKAIAKAAPDTARISLYLAIIPKYNHRYVVEGNKPSDSLAFFRVIQDCRTLSTKLHHTWGQGTSYLWEAWFYNTLRNFPKRDELLAQAFSLFRAANDKKGLSNSWYYKAEMRSGIPGDPALMNAYDSAYVLARESGDTRREIQALRAIGNMHRNQGNHAQAIKELQTVLELQKKTGDTRIHHTTDMLVLVYAQSGNHKEALRSAIASIDYSRKFNDTALIVTFYQRLGAVYYDMSDYDRSFYYFGRALSSYKPGKQKINQVVTISILAGMAQCLMKQEKYREALNFLSDQSKKYQLESLESIDYLHFIYMDVYYYMGDYRAAEKTLSLLFKHIDDWYFVRESLLRLYIRAGQLYLQLNQPEKAAYYSDSAYAMGRAINARDVLRDVSLTLYRIDSIKGNYLPALGHYIEYKAMSDSIQKDVADKQLAELAVQYETDQKNTQLTLLANRAQLQQETIQKSKSLRNAMIVGSALLLLLLFVTYNRYRLKQKANTLLQEHQDEINRQNTMLEKMVREEKKITEEKDKLLAEKEWLMKEINHRVKNNLQVVMSLLNTQSSYLKDEAALNAIQESRHRVHAISLIHRKLYQTDRLLTVIDMSTYIKEVVEYLGDNLDIQHHIAFGLHVDPINLDVTQAVPTGLIINEAITNAVKYAFPDARKGQIDIYMYKTVEGRIELLVSDNGIGLPDNFDWQHTESLGMSLMSGLSRQLDGNFEAVQKNGLTIKISFEPGKSPDQ